MRNHHTRASLYLFAALGSAIIGATAPARGQVINEDHKLLASDGSAYHRFGEAIGIGGGIVAVGARFDDDNGGSSGSVYLYDAATGAQTAKLIASDGSNNDFFGYSVAVDDGVVAIGAEADKDNGYDSGSAYLFDAATGLQLTKLLAFDGAANDYFGHSIAIANGIVVVGAYLDDDNGLGSGSVYLFNAATGAFITKLIASDGAAVDWFGFSVAIGNGYIVVGAPLHNDNGSSSGAVYVFDASTGVQVTKLLAADGATNDEFGTAVAIDNGIVAVGAYRDDDNGNQSGSAYLFDAATGAQTAKLIADDGIENDWFGSSIAFDSGIVAVGANFDNSWSGSAYLFDAATGSQITKLIPSDVADRDQFGYAIALDNGVVAAGSYWDDANGTGSGSAYLFGVPAADCPADLTGDGTLDAFDVFQFLADYDNGACSGPAGDFNGDGACDAFDVFGFLDAYDNANGCP